MHEDVTVKQQISDRSFPEKVLTHLSTHHLTVNAALETCYFNFQCCQYGSPRSCSLSSKAKKGERGSGGLSAAFLLQNFFFFLLVLVSIIDPRSGGLFFQSY